MWVGCPVIRKVILCNICCVNGRFCSQKVITPEPDFRVFIIRYFKRSCHLTCFQMCLDGLYKFQFFCKCLVHSCLFGNLCNSSVKNLNIRKDQFQIDRLNISCRIDRSVHMDNIGILKTTYHMYDSIYLTDICKELVSKSLALAGSLYKSCNIYKFDGSRCYFLRMIKFTEFYDPLIRYRNDSDVRINRCEWIVCG